jgi:hypothetical protein
MSADGKGAQRMKRALFFSLLLTVLLGLPCFAGTARWFWEEPQAEVLPTGDLEWAPHPFAFAAGKSVRYIDFEYGRDDNPGTSKERPWQHHPWDPNATGRAKEDGGAHTYVFKRGVVYRGVLRASDVQGAAGDPVRLTSDPSWGTGEAVLAGSVRVAGPWRRADASTAPKVPEPEKVWYCDFAGEQPRLLWEVRGAEPVRLPLARTPNWQESNPDDIRSEWFEWDKCEKGDLSPGHKGWFGTARTAWPSDDPDYYLGATLWTEWMPVMGTPYPTTVETVDVEKRTLGFQGFWYEDSGDHIQYNRWYLENKPQYLDQDGEWYYDGEAHRLYLRPGEGRDPNALHVEAAQAYFLLDVRNASHLDVSGLTFRFMNVWDWPARFFVSPDVEGAAVRITGTGEDIAVRDCRFLDVNTALRIGALEDSDRLSGVMVSDNEVVEAENAAFIIENSSRWGKSDPPFSVLDDVRVLRNRLHRIGLRPIRSESGHALEVRFARRLEVAGNFVDRTGGSGIFIFGGKGSGEKGDVPFSRTLIHHNKVTDPLLMCNDWGGIETWQGGPHYVFDNISASPGGYWHWVDTYHRDDPNRGWGTARLGFAYYLDGSFKNYVFNNIAWGKSSDLTSPLCNAAAFEEPISYQNVIFNNTIYRFGLGSIRQGNQTGRNQFLGNIWDDLSDLVFEHAPRKEERAANADQFGPQTQTFFVDQEAYARNVFYFPKPPRAAGIFEGTGTVYPTIPALAKAMKAAGAQAGEVGVVSDRPLLRDPAHGDMRPAPGSAATDAGVRAFVPWALSAVVGEWSFCPNLSEPERVFDSHWYLESHYVDRETYWRIPMNDLRAENVTAQDYVQGPLEDWTTGALRFNGRDQQCVLTDAEMKAPFSLGRGDEKTTVTDRATLDMATNSFLIEIYFRTQPGQKRGTLVSKLGDSGYALSLNAAGAPVLTLRSGAASDETAATTPVNDGAWHHVIAEVDRAARRATLYVDGRNAGDGGLSLAREASLANAADFVVGHGFAGAIDFLRVSHGTLADAHTSIEELYAWEFDGPFLRDFCGRRPAGKGRDAGAVEGK